MAPPNQYELYKFCPHCGNNLHAEEKDEEKVKVCKKCGFIFWNKSKPVVSMIIHKNNKVLLLERAREPFKHYWVLPGGFTSYLEDAEIAIRREVREEIGIEVNIEKIIGTYLITNDPRSMHLDIVFSGTAQEEITLNQESTNWKYFSPEKLPDKMTYRDKDAIMDWYKKGSKYD